MTAHVLVDMKGASAYDHPLFPGIPGGHGPARGLNPAVGMNPQSRRWSLELGPGMRVQRAAEGLVLLLAILSLDLRLAYVTFALLAAQVVWPKAAPLAWLVLALRRPPERHRIGDLYFDLGASRGSCLVSVLMHAVAFVLIGYGPAWLGWLFLAAPTASLLLSATVGFCAGCGVYVGLCDGLRRLGLLRRHEHARQSFALDDAAPDRQ